MESYDTVVDAIDGLIKRGFTINFNIAFDKIICSNNRICLSPDEFEITEVHRFEGDTNPSDEDVVYAVQSKDGNTKGYMSSAFGIYADPASTDMIRKLSMHAG